MRALSQIEQALTITNISYPLSAVCVIRLRKGPSAKHLQSSLDRLKKHYPLLGSVITKKGGGFCFERDLEEKPVKLRPLERNGENHWLGLVRDELNLGFDHGLSPLMRALYLEPSPGTGPSEIILSFHHAIVDAEFLMVFADQLLTLAGQDKSGLEQVLGTLSKTADPSPLLADILPQSFRMPRLFFRLLPFMSRQLKNEKDYKKRTGVKDSAIPASSENNVTTLGFTEEETISLIKWSREQGLSLNSIITAAMLMVVNEFKYDKRKKMLRAVQFANLRPFTHPPVGKHVAGSFIAMMRFNIALSKPLSQENEIIQIAKNFDSQLRVSVKRGDKFLFSLLSKILIKKSFRDKKERLSATALSYAGPIKLKKNYGTLELADMHGFITNNCLGPELSGFGKICFKRLSLDINFLAAETDDHKALKMTNAIKSSLLQLKPKA